MAPKYIMKNRMISKLRIFFIVVFCLFYSTLFARDLQVSLAFLPKILESPNEGVFVDLVKAIDNEYTEGNFDIKVYPMARSITNVVNGAADFHIPMIRNSIVPEEQLPFRFTTENLGKVVLVIYSNRDAPITAQMINAVKDKVPFPYKIETGRGLETYFDFPITPISNLDSSLRKVSIMRTGALIWAQEETDYLLKTLNIKAIHREFYNEYDDVAVIPKGPKGDEIDAILTKAIKKLRASGRLAELHQKIHVPYVDWQPYSQ
ncbi:ABC transporter substrate-binding protein [bacterium]|nr:ABC transporter substrate-binding protein [bacterium]